MRHHFVLLTMLFLFLFTKNNAQQPKVNTGDTAKTKDSTKARDRANVDSYSTKNKREIRKAQLKKANKKDYDSLIVERDSIINRLAGTNIKGVSEIEVVGNGNIQKSFTEGAPFEANTGLGIIFYRAWNPYKFVSNLEMDIAINVASTADSLIAEFDNTNVLQNRRIFGDYILQPINSKQAITTNLTLYFGSGDWRWITPVVSGIHARLYASNAIWTFKNKSTNLSAYYFRAGIFQEVLPDKIRLDPERRFSITIGAYYSWRGISGDITIKENDSLRAAILGVERKCYNGFEFGLGFRLKNIRVDFTVPIISDKKDDKGDKAVPGVTNSPFLFSLRFVGGFPVRLRKEDKKEETPADKLKELGL